MAIDMQIDWFDVLCRSVIKLKNQFDKESVGHLRIVSAVFEDNCIQKVRVSVSVCGDPNR